MIHPSSLDSLGLGVPTQEGVGKEIVKWEQRFLDEVDAHRATAAAAVDRERELVGRERELAAAAAELNAKLAALDAAIAQTGMFGVRRLRRTAQNLLNNEAATAAVPATDPLPGPIAEA